MDKLSNPYMTTGKTIALTKWTFVSKVMSLLFNMLFRLVIAFLPRSTHILISWLQSPFFGTPQNKVCHCFHCFPIYSPWSNGATCHDLSFLKLSFKLAFSFSFIKKLFSSSLLSAIRVVSTACLRLLICLPAILIPGCASSSLAFQMMYSAYKLNKQGDNVEPWCTPFPIWTSPLFPVWFCCFLTCICIALCFLSTCPAQM